MKLELLDTISLAHGKHESPDEGACIMEAIALVADEDFSDHPECVCPAISDFLRSWNDGLPNDAERNRLLKPLALAVIGTRSTPEVEMRRRWMAFDWLVRVNAPAWMDLTDALKPHAAALRGLPKIDGPDALDLCMPVLKEAWDAAWAAARAAAWDAAWAAAVAAARAAARDAAWAAALAAARDAARDAAVAAARDAAVAAAVAAARAAAWDAAWAAALAAARAAARGTLAPTTAALQASAQDLVRRMAEER